MHKFYENYLPGYGAYSTDLGAETSDKIETAVFMNMRYYDLGIAQAQVTNVASGSVITLTILEGTTSAGAGSATTSQTDTFTSTATSDTDVLKAEIRAEQLSANYTHFGARLATNNASGTEVASVILIAGRARYGSGTLPANT